MSQSVKKQKATIQQKGQESERVRMRKMGVVR